MACLGVEGLKLRGLGFKRDCVFKAGGSPIGKSSVLGG